VTLRVRLPSLSEGVGHRLLVQWRPARSTTAFASLMKVNYPDYEVILVDDGSTDKHAGDRSEVSAGRQHQAEEHGFELRAKRGRARGTGDVFAYTDGDCMADPDCCISWSARS